MSTQNQPLLKVVLMSIGGRGATILNRLESLETLGGKRVAIGTKEALLSATNVTKKIELSHTSILEDYNNLQQSTSTSQLKGICEAMEGSEIVFLIGNIHNVKNATQTSQIAKIARQNGSLVLYISATPFAFEGSLKLSLTGQGKELLKDQVDGLLIVESDKILAHGGVAKDALTQVDTVIGNMITMITELVMKFGVINVDFADLKSTIQNSGKLFFNSIQGKRDDIEGIVENIFSQSFLDTGLSKIHKALYVIYAGKDVLIDEINSIGQKIQGHLDEQARIIFGVVQDEKLKNDLKIVFIGG